MASLFIVHAKNTAAARTIHLNFTSKTQASIAAAALREDGYLADVEDAQEVLFTNAKEAYETAKVFLRHG